MDTDWLRYLAKIIYHYLYIIIHWWIWPRAWLTWTDGRGSAAGADGRVQTGCGRGWRERGRHGAWLMAGGQATIERSEIVACKLYLCWIII